MKKSITLLGLVALVLSINPLTAQKTWAIDPANSKIGFEVTELLIKKVRGTFNEFEGTLVSENSNFENSVITFEAKVSSIDTGKKKRDNHLRNPDFFDEKNYPTISFESTSFKPGSGNNYVLKGNLNMHGVTKPVSLDVIRDGNTFEIKGTITRQDWGLNWSKTNKAGEAVVGDEIRLSMSVTLVEKTS